MAIEDYWASTARNAKDIAQYLVYPIFKVGALVTLKDANKANIIAGVATSAFYAGLTEVFLGREMDGFDRMARPAVAAELGKKPEDITFEDYLRSDNSAVKRRMQLFKHEHWQRYGVSLMPMLPTVMEYATRHINPGGALTKPHTEDIAKGNSRYRKDNSGRPAPNAPVLEHLLHGWNLWDTVVYAGVALLWLYETYGVEKTFAYQGRKEMENSESLGLKVGPNNIAGLYNRMRGDRGLPHITNKHDREILWPLFEQVAEKVNHAHGFGLPEMMYLMGLRKLDVFKKDADGHEMLDDKGCRQIDELAMKRALAELDLVEQKGLKAIAHDNHKLAMKPKQSELGLVDKLSAKWYDMNFGLYKAVAGRRKLFAENISPRDPSENPYSL
jgi:hypothetical protein